MAINSLEQNMNMIFVVIPFYAINFVVRRNAFKNLFRSARYSSIKHFLSVLGDKYQVIVEQKD